MKQIFIERQDDAIRVAIKENDMLKECIMGEESDSPYPGQIYKGVVQNIVPAIKCAFIDIGYKKNAYMYMDSKFKNTSVKKGQEIIVQVLKEELGNKGPKVTNVVAFPGRYCVLDTFSKELAFSRKIEDEAFKEEMRRSLKMPEDAGVKVRTNAVKVDVSVINDEIRDLNEVYKAVMQTATYTSKNSLVYDDGGIIGRIARDKMDENVRQVFASDEEDAMKLKNVIGKLEDVECEVVLHKEDRTLFDSYGIEKEILSLRNDKVYLNCGGYIIINKTEAMHVIDVNSGKNVKENSIQKTAFITNLQAAEEVARQVKLRNLSGIIVVDFIDMNDSDHKDKVMQKLRQGFLGDKNKTTIYDFTELNLVQIARRRMGRPLGDYLEEQCMCCKGRGKRIKFQYLKRLLKNEVCKINKQHDIKDIYIELDEMYEEDVRGDVLKFAQEIDALDKSIYVKFMRYEDHYKVEPIIFMNQKENLKILKIYG